VRGEGERVAPVVAPDVARQHGDGGGGARRVLDLGLGRRRRGELARVRDALARLDTGASAGAPANGGTYAFSVRNAASSAAPRSTSASFESRRAGSWRG
jgi:hypothetical protein